MLEMKIELVISGLDAKLVAKLYEIFVDIIATFGGLAGGYVGPVPDDEEDADGED